MSTEPCVLCATEGGIPVFQGEKFRVIRAQEAGFPAFYRVIWMAHVAELSDLDAPDLALCMAAVVAVERVLREQLQPTKINLAALGNMVAHLHWHVIARFDWDSHFPAPVWATAQREPEAAALAQVTAKLGVLDQALAQSLTALILPA